jgi:hypothetical protein
LETNSLFSMPVSSLWGLIVGVSVVSVGLYHLAFVGPRLRAIARALAGEGDAADADSLALLKAAANKTNGRVDVLEALARKDLYRVGFVRYNSFADVGSDLSFTLALLNADGDGVVISSIYSREETRTFGKAVRQFTAQAGASKEEESAIAMARAGASGALVGGPA